MRLITLKEIHERDNRPPSVTVSMTCYNHAKYLDEAIRGVLMQKTNFPVNIVIHDDASTDESQEIIRRYAAENPNITAILEETNYYQNGRSFFPKVLPHLTGKYIAYCECDDFWIDEHKLQIQVDYLEANPDCVAVYSNTLPVNKHSQYDESERVPCFPKTGEGDYASNWVVGIQHQLASLMQRNFWQFVNQEEINFYIAVKCNRDEKIFSMLLQLGRVHYFSEEFAAHRHVTDEGDSYSARTAGRTKYERLKSILSQNAELYRMIEYFFGKMYYRRYMITLWEDLKGRIQYHKSAIKDIPLSDCYQYSNIPWYTWLAFSMYVPYKVARKIVKSILPEKLLTWIRKRRYNLFSADYSHLVRTHRSISFRKNYVLSRKITAGRFFVREVAA